MIKRLHGLHIVFVAVACMLALSATAHAQLPNPTYGWNLGNTLEPPCGEGCWGPAATQQLIDAVAAGGFNTIRIPVAWNSHANQTTYAIDPVWMARVKQVVDWCLAKNLTVVINSHWDDGWLDSRLDGNVDADVNAKMLSYWTQIAQAFTSYDSKLLFSGANEPPVDNAAEMSELMTYYQTFVDAVRGAGGSNNTARWLILSGPNTNIDQTDTLMNTLPSDPTPGRLAVEVHYYDPYQLTLMTADAVWGKMFYFWGQGYHHATRTDRNANWGEEAWVIAEFNKLQAKFTSQGVPVLLGEFGTVKRSGYSDLTGTDFNLHLASRTYWNKVILDHANSRGIRPVYWDNGAEGKDGFALFNRNTGAVVDQAGITSLTGGGAQLPPGSTFTLASSPTSVSVTRGSNTTSTINITRTNFTGSVAFTASGLPSGVTAGFNPSSTTGNSSVLTLTASGTATTGNSTVTVTGLSGSTVRTTTVSLTVNASGGAGPVPNGTYKVIARHSAKGLDVKAHGTANGSIVHQWAYSAGNNQKWTLTYLGSNQYKIIGVESGKALEVASTSTANGTNIDIRTYTGAGNQKWTLTATSGGYYRVTPVSSSGSCLDVNGNSTANGAKVQQWSYSGGTNQQWIFQAP